jgi:hypothetical protein
MAVEFKAPSLTRTSEYLLAPRDIKFVPELNGRHEAPDIEWMIESFATIGQITPIGIRKDGTDAVLAFGFSRWRAAVEGIKQKRLPADFKLRCVYFKGDEEAGFLANIAENRERNGTTAIDDAYNMARLERWGKSVEDIVKIYHPTDEFGVLLDSKQAEKWVKDRLALTQLSKSSTEAVKDGIIKPSAVKVLAELSAEQQNFVVKQAKKDGKKITAASLKEARPKKPKKKTDEEPSLLDIAGADEVESVPAQIPLAEGTPGVPNPERFGLHPNQDQQAVYTDEYGKAFRQGHEQRGVLREVGILYELVSSIAEGGKIPFEWEYDVDAREFCKLLLKAV